LTKLLTYDVIAVDEGHFFGDDLVRTATLLANSGKLVYISALSGSYQQRPLDTTSKLLAIADHVEFKSAMCACRKEAGFTHRIVPVDPENPVLVGGAESYEAICRQCLVKKTLNWQIPL